MSRLETLLIDRLGEHPLPSQAEEDVLIAALIGDDALQQALGGTSPPRPTASIDGQDGRPSEPAGAYLKSVTVSGFRGIGPATTLELAPGPGLTVVCGRNGSGKSSFAEALEVLLTGSIRRLEDRTAVWRSAWRCLHGGDAEVSADIYLEGSKGPTKVARRWAAEDKGFADAATKVRAPGQPDAGLERLGWADALHLYRPFLSHAELEVLLWEPSKLYDQLNNLLGLDEINTLADRLKNARKRLDPVPAAAKTQLTDLRSLLTDSNDERAVQLANLLKPTNPDLDALQHLLGIETSPEDTSILGILGRLRALNVPATEEVNALADRLRQSARSLEEIGSSAAGDAAATAALLEAAVEHFNRHGSGPCPVCGRSDALDEQWRRETAEKVARLQSQAADLRTARADAETALRETRLLVGGPPTDLDQAVQAGIDASATISTWTAWSQTPEATPDAPSSLDALARHLCDRHPELNRATDALRVAAAAELEVRQDRWVPIAASLASWVVAERDARQARQATGRIKKVEAWLKAANDDLRNQRFRPFAQGTAELWSKLRQESNVDLVDMVLTGSNTSRAVDIQVTVDGQAAAGPGVMSQGEINALGLSVFLPRATSIDSPLRFVVIDDPVQAMDPSKVEGMARVLSDVAQDRQVIVFTHDDRLPDALRNLQLPAEIIEVTRRAESIVELRKTRDPAQVLLDDAWKLAAADEIPAAVTGRVIPNLCRQAVEEVCFAIIRQRRLARGDSHEDVEQVLSDTTRFLPRMALAVYDDASRAGDVYAWLKSKIGQWSVDLVSNLNKGSHGDIGRSSKDLVQDSGKLIERFQLQAK